MKATFMETVEYLGQKDPEKRYENLKSLISVPYKTQFNLVTKNIIIPAKKQERVITLSAHWDVYSQSKGYNDNASGMAVLLSLQNELPDNVEILFSDQEECGGRGVSYYLEEHNPILNINVDVVGFGSTVFYDLYGINEVRDSILLDEAVYHPNVPFNDSYIFNRNKVPSVLLITGNSEENVISEIWERQHRGKLDDDLSQLSESTMEMVTETIRKLIHEEV